MATTLIKKRQLENLQITDADVASSAAIALSKIAGSADLLKRDGSVALTGNLDAGNNKITGLAVPIADTDAATKGYVDSVALGFDVKLSVKVATTGDITLSGTQTIDGIALSAGDRVLVKDQALPAENGIYVVAAGAWSRSEDANTNAEVTPGMFTFVEQGSTNGDSGWVLSTDGSITLGTTALNFVQFSGAGQIVAGDGLTKSGNTLNVVGTANRIVVNADSIDIASTYAGQTSITTLGPVTTGTWNATPITDTYIAGISGGKVSGNISGYAANVTGVVAITNGGTGATSAPQARTNLGATTVGSNLFTLSDPSAVTFIRINGDNTVSTLDAATFRAAIGAGTGDGSVTSISMTVPTGLSVSPSTITTSGTFAITYAAGYSIPTNVKQNQWDTAYSTTLVSLRSDKYVKEVISSPTPNGVVTNFNLSQTPVSPTFFMVFVNGVLQNEGSTNDYTLSGSQVTFTYAPATGDVIVATYFVA